MNRWTVSVIALVVLAGLASGAIDADEVTALGRIRTAYPALGSYGYASIYGGRWTGTYSEVCASSVVQYQWYGVSCSLSGPDQGHVNLLRIDTVASVPTSELGDISGLRYVQEVILSGGAALGATSTVLERIFQLPSLKRITISTVMGSTSYASYSAGIPSSLSGLTNLTDITIISNPLVTSLPSIANLVSLKTLDLRYNDLAPDTFQPGDFDNLSSLTSVKMDSNARLASLPISSSMTSLITLSLPNTAVSSLPDVFQEMTSLQTLDLTGCSALTHIPPSVSNCSSLASMSMSGSGLNSTDSVPDMSASKIVQIYAGNMFFYSGLPAGFCTFNPAYVNYLALTNSKLATLPDCLNRYQLIDYLEVSGNNLTVIPSLLTSLPLLRIYGGASNPYMSGPWPVGLGRAQKLSIFNMQGCGLAGPIPGAELANISTLSNLDLSKNQLTGELPDNFFTKGVITQFNVELNRLSGPFPSSVGSRGSSLISILASKNQFTSLPSSLGLLRNLRELDFSDNALTSFPDDSYGRNLTALRYFQIGGNPGLTSPVPTFWANSTYLPQMRDVNISRCGFTGNFPSLDSASLQTVFAFENNLDGTIAPLVKAPSLSVLDIHMNSLQGQIPNSIGVATYLSTFDASYNRLQGTLPPGIAANANAWVTLRLNNNGISGALPNMALFSNLQNFEMQNTFLDLCAIPAQFNTYSPLSSSTCFLYNVGYPGSCFCASNYARCVSNSTDCPAPGYESTPAPLGPAPTPIRPPQVGGISPSSNPSAEPSSASEPEVSVPGIQAEVPTQEPTSPAPASVTSTTYVVAFLGCLVALSLSM